MVKYLIVILLFSNVCMADTYEVAASTAMTAAYKQSGYDSYVNAYANNLAVKYVPVEMKNPAAVAFFIYRLVNDRSVGFRWTF